LFVRKAILQMQNAAVTDLKRGIAIASRPVKAPKERDAYLPATLSADATGSLFAEPLNWHGSSDFIGFARADALIVVPHAKSFDSGERVKVLYL
jgi:molybdopterin biosynthesis enzyme